MYTHIKAGRFWMGKGVASGASKVPRPEAAETQFPEVSGSRRPVELAVHGAAPGDTRSRPAESRGGSSKSVAI